MILGGWMFLMSEVERVLYREFMTDSILVQRHSIIVMIRWTGHTPWQFEFPFPGSLTSTFLVQGLSAE